MVIVCSGCMIDFAELTNTIIGNSETSKYEKLIIDEWEICGAIIDDNVIPVPSSKGSITIKANHTAIIHGSDEEIELTWYFKDYDDELARYVFSLEDDGSFLGGISTDSSNTLLYDQLYIVLDGDCLMFERK